MGLGKTCQLCTHFGSLAFKLLQSSGQSIGYSFTQAATSSTGRRRPIFLVVCPPTVLHHWRREMYVWVPRMRTVIFHSMQQLKSMKARGLEESFNKLRSHTGCIGLCVLMSYEGLRKYKMFCSRIEWSAVCLDEGQKIRNPDAEITSACKLLPCYHRLILTGSPIQNNLSELWSLLDFICPGKLGSLTGKSYLLSSLRNSPYLLLVFELEFCDPIRAGGYAGSTPLQKEVAVRTAAALQRIVKPFLLRRKKADMNDRAHMLPPKTEHVLFCKLSEKQREIYQQIISSPEVDLVLRKRASAFPILTTLRKLCNHPLLAFQKGRVVFDSLRGKPPKKLDRPINRKRSAAEADEDSSDESGLELDEILSYPIDNVSWDDSGKLSVLKKVLPLWKQAGHKVLLFSQTQSMLNLIEKLIKDWNARGYIDNAHENSEGLQFLLGDKNSSSEHQTINYLRLDGSTPMHRRDAIVSSFNSDPSIFVMLLTTRTGGVGISLTAANRVVILDPDWNPQTDVQVS
jgi:DNA excision repair protein ERCC-6